MEAWDAAGQAADSLQRGDWNARNTIVYLVRYLKEHERSFYDAHFQEDVWARVNAYRLKHPGFLSIAEKDCRHDPAQDDKPATVDKVAEKTNTEDFLFE